jgi:hypothetical protein
LEIFNFSKHRPIEGFSPKLEVTFELLHISGEKTLKYIKTFNLFSFGVPPAEGHGAKHHSCRGTSKTKMNKNAQDLKVKWITPAGGLCFASRG